METEYFLTNDLILRIDVIVLKKFLEHHITISYLTMFTDFLFIFRVFLGVETIIVRDKIEFFMILDIDYFFSKFKHSKNESKVSVVLSEKYKCKCKIHVYEHHFKNYMFATRKRKR